MKYFFYCSYLLLVTSGCKYSDKPAIDNPSKHELELKDELELRRFEENHLRILYETHEKMLREDGIIEESRVDAIIQGMIDSGDLITPYVYENGSLKPKFLTYREYKIFRLENPLDTTNSYTYSLPKQDFIPIDSALIKLLSDSLQ